MYQSNRSFNIPCPRSYPSIWYLSPAREREGIWWAQSSQWWGMWYTSQIDASTSPAPGDTPAFDTFLLPGRGREFDELSLPGGGACDVPVKLKLQHPLLPVIPQHLMPFPAWEGGNLMSLVFPGVGHLITTNSGGEFDLSFRLQVTLILNGLINHGRDKRDNRFVVKTKGLPTQALFCIINKDFLIWHPNLATL